MRIRLPYPALVVLAGPSGAGKTTFARRHFEETQVVSSDECRRLVADTDDFHPARSAPAFRLFYLLIEERLRLGRLTVADSTGLIRKGRAELLALARRHDVPAYALVLDPPLERCLAWDQERDRQVGARILEKQFRELEIAKLALPCEGFEAVWHITPEDEADLAIEVEADEFVLPADRPAAPPPEAEGPEAAPPARLEDLLARQPYWSSAFSATPADVENARDRLQAAPTDRPWQVIVPAAPALMTPDLADPAERWEYAVEGALANGLRMALLRAVPAGSPAAVAVFARDADAARRLLGVDDGRAEALLLPDWPHGARPELSGQLAEIGYEMRRAAYFWRRQADLAGFDCRVVRHGEGWRLMPIGPAFPLCESPADEAFFWEFLEVDGDSVAFAQSERLLLTPGNARSAEARAWFVAQVASGREVLVTAMVWGNTFEKTAGLGGGAGYAGPAARLWPVESSLGADPGGLHRLRREAIRALATGNVPQALALTEIAWALHPEWRAADQGDLFSGL
ncbi:MAG: AAA family ATPase [Sumerlaeia bacterium]